LNIYGTLLRPLNISNVTLNLMSVEDIIQRTAEFDTLNTAYAIIRNIRKGEITSMWFIWKFMFVSKNKE
jgi:hypothetical protein